MLLKCIKLGQKSIKRSKLAREEKKKRKCIFLNIKFNQIKHINTNKMRFFYVQLSA